MTYHWEHSFRPETLACRPGQDTATCLTIPQIDALHKIYADYWETNQTWIFGPYYPGGETAYPYGLVAAEPNAIPVSWFRYFITKCVNGSTSGDTSDTVLCIATLRGPLRTTTRLSSSSRRRSTPGRAMFVSWVIIVYLLTRYPQAISPNLTAFVGSGRNGKLLHYVGWADQLISPGNSLHYYETVHAFMTSYSELDINDFYRLYTVPGMNHW